MERLLAVLEGEVIRGRQIGRTIGFPTANLRIDSEHTQMDHGVYGVTVLLHDRKYYGVLNKGVRPTFNDQSHISYEVHLFDFDQDIYDERLQVYVHFFVREEIAFHSVGELIHQIKSDVLAVKARFGSSPAFTFAAQETGETKSPIPDNIINLTDLQFVKYCEDRFGVNRGVYNTIDSWFYNKGIENVLMRRTKILQFFQYLSSHKKEDQVRISFGHGGLTSRLGTFWDAI